MKVLVIGHSGQLAKQFVALSPEQVKCICIGRTALGGNDLSGLAHVFASFKPDYVINTAAYTAVDKAEIDKDAAFFTNVLLVRRLISLCRPDRIPLLQLSTDQVFDGHKRTPYTTEDQCAAVNYYGYTKWLAEQELIQTYAEYSLIIRTSWLYSCYGSNFVTKIMGLLMSDSISELSVPVDQCGSPTWAYGLAQVLWRLILSGSYSGLLHYADEGEVSRYQFTLDIQQLAMKKGLLPESKTIRAASSLELKLPAERPAYSALDSVSIRQLLLLPSSGWYSQLSLMLDQYKAIDEL
jgi:dTDP-4-dehydrorhamnose reductase